jgi:hypothetical protein
MENGVLKHICVWILLLLLFILFLYGVHQFFFSRMEFRVKKKISLSELEFKHTLPFYKVDSRWMVNLEVSNGETIKPDCLFG